MKKLVIISDTHGKKEGLTAISGILQENDYIVHLGDGATEVYKLLDEYPEKTYFCAGNCDFAPHFPTCGVLEIEKLSIFYCHGHEYGVKSSLQSLARAAKAQGCEIALYGHTHRADVTEIDGVTLINPGSFQRKVGNGGSYCYLVINGDKFTPVIVGESVY